MTRGNTDRPRGAGLRAALFVLLAVAAGGAAVILAGRSPASEGGATPPPEDRVVFACPGRIEGASDPVDVSASTDGVLTEVLVEEGDRVEAGQLIAVVDKREREAELLAALAATDSARGALARLLRGSRDEERRVASAAEDAARASRDEAAAHCARMERLYTAGVVSRDEAERARRDRDVAEATLRETTSRSDLANAPPLEEELARARADVEAAERRADAAAARLAKCSVRAPSAGTVLRVHLHAGDAVSSAFPRPIATIADTSRLRVRAEVDERDVGRIEGCPTALIVADAYPGLELPGRVSRRVPVMGRKTVRTGDPAEKSDRDVLEVLVDLDDPTPRPPVGLRVTVRFER